MKRIKEETYRVGLCFSHSKRNSTNDMITKHLVTTVLKNYNIKLHSIK